MAAIDESGWPSATDKLFPKQQQAQSARTSDEIFAALVKPELGNFYREGYFEAAACLSVRTLSASGTDALHPGVVFPIVFCYRHYLELSLKALIEVSARLSSEPVRDGFDVAKEHSLMKLWNEARRLSARGFPEPPEGDTTDNDVERLINEFNQVDANSQTFRYATDKDGNTVEPLPPEIDLIQLGNTMRKLKRFFDGSMDYADHLIDLSNDVRCP